MSFHPRQRNYQDYPGQPQQRGINGTAPYAQPENNKGANPAAGEIRGKWGWGSSPDTASDEIKAQWARKRDAAQVQQAVGRSPLYSGPDFTLPVGSSGAVPGASNNIPAVEAGKPAGKPYQGNGGTYFA